MSDKPLARVEGSTSIYRASGVGGCIRGLVASRLGYDPLPPDDKLEVIFKEGHRAEGPVIEDLEAEGMEVQRFDEEGNQLAIRLPVSERIVIEGHMDGLVDGRVLEIKALGKDTFATWQRHGFKKFDTYATQISVYMAATGRKAYYVVKNRNNGQLDRTLIDEMPVDINEVKKKVLRAEAWARKGELPPCDVEAKWNCPFRYLHENGDRPTVENDEAIEALAQAYRDACEREKEVAGVKKEARQRLVEVLGGRERVESASFKVGQWVQVRKKLDVDRMKEELGETAVERYQVETSYPVLRVWEKKDA